MKRPPQPLLTVAARTRRSPHAQFLIAFCLATLPASASRIVPDRYIVELTGPPVAARTAARGIRPDIAVVVGHRAQIRAEQQRARAALEREGAQILDSVDTVANALMVRMPASEAARLELVPGVKRVHPVRQFKLLLDRAVVVTKVNEAWNLIGLNHAGAGIKIGIIDTGIDNAHAGFQDASLTVPGGFPKVNQDSDKSFTNHKVIVARSYASLFAATDPDPSARDHVGHGTGTAMTAAGVLNAGPLATIRGVAPKAYLGSYKVFGSPGVNDFASEDAILKAIDDAVTDGMDVINISLGDAIAESLDQDLEAMAVEHATSMGVVVVVSAGNAGPDPQTVGPPASAPAAISVGASDNDRQFAAGAALGGKNYVAIPGDGPAPAGPVTGRFKDVATLDQDGLACKPFAAGSLKGEVAFILRGTCFFSDKIANVVAGGAAGALMYTDQARPDPIVMSVSPATLPAMMVSYADGISIKGQLAANQTLTGTLDFTIGPRFIDPDTLADFTSKGPDVDYSIKPDLVAVGENLYTAAEKSDPKGILYSPNGYAIVDGTSFSSPLVAGAAALLMQARPGLTVAGYRSLLVNTAAPISLTPGFPARVQQAGAGLLDMNAAMRATSAESPSSISLGQGAADVQSSRTLTVTNIGSKAETFTIFTTERNAPTGFVPPGSRTATVLETSGKQPSVTLSKHTLQLNAGASANVTVTMTGFDLPAGAYEGSIHVMGTTSGVDEHVPYWYGVASTVPAHITVLNTVDKPKPGTLNTDAALFRVTDANGITIAGAKPTATVVSGGGTVVGVADRGAFYPGVFGLNVRLGTVAGDNVFQIQVGVLKQTVDITSQ